MSNVVRVSKLEAAQRQLDVAIQLMFADADAIAVHTLVGAASLLMSDLIEHRAPSKSWDKQAQEANNLKSTEYFRIMRTSQNFLKHARADPYGILELDPCDTESLAFWVVMNGSELSPMSIEAQVFQLWYIASHAPLKSTESPLREAIEVLGDLRSIPRGERLRIGAKALTEARGL